MTEQEIYEGILDSKKRKDPWSTSLVFIRYIKDIEQKLTANLKLAKRFIDLTQEGKVNMLVKDRLNKLKNVDIKKAYNNKNKEKNVTEFEPVI